MTFVDIIRKMRIITGIVYHCHQRTLVGAVVLTEALFDLAARHSFAHPAATFAGVKAETAGFRHTIAEDVLGAS